MKLLSLFLLLVVGVSCVHSRPDQWWPSDHRGMMQECRALCLNKVRSYETITGSCHCHKGGRP